MRVVEVAVGFADNTWESIIVEIPEEDGEFMSDEDASEIAEEEVSESMGNKRFDAVFIHAFSIMDGEEGGI